MSEETFRLSERAMLVSLAVGAWTGRVTDKEVTDEVIANKHAEKGAGQWTKQLVAYKYLKHVGSKISAARASHKALTLPWQDGGTRILAATGYMKYAEEMHLAKQAVEAAAKEAFTDEKLVEYKEEARSRLGNTYVEEDFPPADQIRAKFYVDVEISPVPEAGDFRTKLSEKTVNAVMKDIERRTEERLKKANCDIYQRVADVCEKMVERLQAYEPAASSEASSGRFKDSLVWNVQELAELLPVLNVTGSQKIEDMREKLLALTEHSPTILRIDEQARRSTASKAEKLLAKAKQYLG